MLPEERIDMWERMYVKINEKLRLWQSIAEQRRERRDQIVQARRWPAKSPFTGQCRDAWRRAAEPGTTWSAGGWRGMPKTKPEGL